MRPLLKITQPGLFATNNMHALLMGATGDYCHLCESRLPDRAHAFHKITGASLEGLTNVNTWPHLLLLCEVCYRSHQQTMISSHLNVVPQGLYFPDEQTDFPPNDYTYPFVYEKKQVTLMLTGHDDDQVISSAPLEMVIVSGVTKSARDTITYFKLNTAYYDEEKNIFRLPAEHPLPVLDLRVYQRTQVWDIAADFIHRYRQLLEIDKTFFATMLEQGRLLAAAAGFWSVWATLLWQETKDRNILLSLLSSPLNTNAETALALRTDYGPHNTYPGTNPAIWK